MRSALLNLSLDPDLQGASERSSNWVNPVIPGDHPDPSVIRVRDTFWASSTSGEWSPQFPLFQSKDLKHWTPSGAVFFHQPAWADGSFWAPELVEDQGRFFVYYVAHKRGGPLCIAVATADQPEGPYSDQGPIVCQELGSIDPCFARDEHGHPFLIWKEDGNSQGKPTPIWAQPLSGDLLGMIGEKRMLITNDSPWEEGIVEGPYLLRHAHFFYLFYAGNSCCGRECKYAEGVARAKHLLGPWEKFPGNPIIGANDKWRCPGHGTAVHGDPRHDYLLYHAYPAPGTIYVGREAVLDEIEWTPDGWPRVNAGRGPGTGAKDRTIVPSIDFSDDFDAPFLGPAWQWPVNTHPMTQTRDRQLTLGIPTPERPTPVRSAMVAVPRPTSVLYEATVTLKSQSHAGTASMWGGLAVVGDPFNTIGLGLRENRLVLWHRAGDRQNELWSTTTDSGPCRLRVAACDPAHHLKFSYSFEGRVWMDAGDPYNASDLPAWDRGLRIGLLLEGDQGSSAVFSGFHLRALG